ncbi:MAG: tRNA (N(6)-L-threonylcarbamoyladenosine(37)-C(2))-methylthiotransferase MtaB [Bacteroidales bacterium]|nr:tRNA (N(6)-L-threonylcarbamoyladenosine(37)-C(2))-methylthiotransferase MtaB [Bacteroidales bacterium]
MKTIAFKTLGCRVNLYETDALASRFKAAGYDIAENDGDADAYVVNTCTVTNTSDQKCRQAIHQIRRKHPEALIAVTGCMVNHRKEELLQSGVADYVIDNERKSALFDIIDEHFRTGHSDPEGYDRDLFSYQPAFDTFHTRSLIKIHDGCNNFCSYCIIPMVRGRSTSRPAEDICNNVREVVAHGFKEIVLTGVNMGRYQYESTNFEQLVENILEIDGDFRVRVSSIEPDQFSDRFLGLFQHEKLAPHMHICLQSGSDDTLKRMHRFYTVAQFRDMCERIKAFRPDFNLTTDIIVGFPGETEQTFSESCDFAREIGFSHIHTFKYSKRTGTKAASMPNQVPEKEKTERSEVMRQISLENKNKYFEMMQGHSQRMLIERIDSKGVARGYGENYVPVMLKDASAEKNTFINLRLGEIVHAGNEEKIAFFGESAI